MYAWQLPLQLHAYPGGLDVEQPRLKFGLGTSHQFSVWARGAKSKPKLILEVRRCNGDSFQL